MKKIESFTVDHTKLLPGLYVSRRDVSGDITATTFDLRVTLPNREPAMDIAAMHTIEHLGATYLRNSSQKDDIIYFGPMGCRTGFYLVMFGKLEVPDILSLVRDTFTFIQSFGGPIPGASAIECGNYMSHDLPMAKYYAEKYLSALSKYQSFSYPASPALQK